MSKGWDNATLKKLKALTGKGLSTAEIGKRLGLSKNSIVGKLNRLGWNSKAGGVDAVSTAKSPVTKKITKQSVKKAVPAKKTVAPAKKSVAAKNPVVAAKAAKKVTEKATKDKKTSPKNLAMHQRIIQHALGMANLKSDHCRWPIGDPDSENFHFCGARVFSGKPYCYEHCKQAYQFTPPKKK